MNIKMVSMDLVSTTTGVENKKSKRQRLKVGDPDFEPPDGGWGWLIVFACGFGNLCSFPMFQQYGLVFKEKFKVVGISQSETITILNVTTAFNSGIGLINGPLFRIFSQRQVALMSSCFVVIALLVCAYCTEFWSHLLFFSILYGASFGLLEAANSLAINTYFEKKRRVATGLSWTVSALGPIVCPYIVVFYDRIYGIQGVIILFAGVAMHSFVCALFVQPVEWHTKYRDSKKTEVEPSIPETKSIEAPQLDKYSYVNLAYYNTNNEKNISEDKVAITEATEKKLEADDDQDRLPCGCTMENMTDVELNSEETSENENPKEFDRPDPAGDANFEKMQSFVGNTDTSEENQSNLMNIIKNRKHTLKISSEDLTRKEKDQSAESMELMMKRIKETEMQLESQKLDEKKLSFWQKTYLYFDFDLLKDYVYVNLNIGLTLANIAEMNFSPLIPIILAEFKFTEIEIANFLSLLAITDIVVRFVISVIADKIGWSNRNFFLFGVMSMAIGRVILVHAPNYEVSLAIAVFIGIGTAFRAVFMLLVIPSHVPLERLPAAYGLQFAVSGITFIICGPVVGMLHEAVGRSYVITTHILNICTYVTAISWIVEEYITKRRKNKKKQPEECKIDGK